MYLPLYNSIHVHDILHDIVLIYNMSPDAMKYLRLHREMTMQLAIKIIQVTGDKTSRLLALAWDTLPT